MDLARNRRNEWRMVKQERQQRREEKEAAENARKAEERVEVMATAETENEPAEETPVTREGEDRDLRMRDESEVEER